MWIMGSFISFREEMAAVNAIIRRRWEISLRYPLSFVFWTFSPILYLLPMLIFADFIVGGRYSDSLFKLTGIRDVWLFVGVGMISLRFLYGVMWESAYSIREEEFHGTLEPVYVAPMTRFSFILGNTLFSAQRGILVLLVQLLVVKLLLPQLSMYRIILSMVFIVLGVFLIQGMALVLGGIVLTVKEGWKILFTIEMLLSLITPAAFPVGVLPEPMRIVSTYSPLTIIVEGFRNVLLLGAGVLDLSQVGVLFLFILFFHVVGIWYFRLQDMKLRGTGRLGQY